MSSHLDTDRLSPGWWLIAPVGLAIILIILAQSAPEFYRLWLDNEARGALELSQVVLLVWSFVVAVRMLGQRQVRAMPWLFGWVGLAALASFYTAGEEASWGQHYLGWATPDSWSVINDQGETNLHNVSSWFDQKPRLLLEIGVVLGGILVPIIAWLRPAIRRHRFAIILPPAICLPVALLAELAKLSERLIAMSGGQGYLFSRASEVQELYFYWFILLYLVVLRRRVTSSSATVAAAEPAPATAGQRRLHP